MKPAVDSEAFLPKGISYYCERHEKGLLLLIFTAGLLIRLFWIGIDFNITADLPILRDWAVRLHQDGLVSFYDNLEIRAYPPLSIYLIAGAGWLDAKLSKPAEAGGSFLNALIKFPAVLADIALAVLLVRQGRGETAVRRLLIAALFLFNPAVWYISAYWGQTDSLYVLFLVAALLLLERGRVVKGWVCYALSLGIKLQGLSLFPLLLVWTWVQHGRSFVVKAAAAAGMTGIVLILPWLLNGRVLQLGRATISSSSRVVQSAYNGWYLVLGDRAGTAGVSQSPGIAPLSYQTISLLLFFAIVLYCTILIARRKEQLSLAALAVILSMAAFMFLTDMRERYLFPVFPLLLWAANRHRYLLWPYLILTATWFFNLITIASFAPDLWTNLVAWQPPYPAHIQLLKGIAWIVSAVHLLIFVWLFWLLEKNSRPTLRPT